MRLWLLRILDNWQERKQTRELVAEIEWMTRTQPTSILESALTQVLNNRDEADRLERLKELDW